jgi:DedD protein
MGLLASLFSRSQPPEAAADAEGGDSVAQARTRARHRLMGAVVLVGIGIVGFPLLFETQPRPIPVDVPIEIPRKETAPALTPPGTRPAADAARTLGSADKPARGARPEVITETAAEAGIATAPPATAKPADKPAEKVEKPLERPAEKLAEKGADTPAPKPAEKPADKPADKPTERPQDKSAVAAAAPSADAARAQALLDGKPASAPAATRYIVQIGAFADPALAQQTRLKVERLGLVTYTHVAKTPDGERTRVRVGPVPTRAEADKMAARLKAAGLPAAILTL